MTIAEVVHLQLKAGTDVNASETKQALEEILRTISEQDGCTGVATGITVEHHESLDLIVEWTEYEKHQQFMDADYYKPFMAKAGGLLTGSPDCLIMHHVHFTPTLLSLALKAPVVEVLLLYTSPDSTDEVPTTLTRFLDILAANAEGTTGSAHGWVREELEKDGVEGKLRGYMVAVGWESVDDHMKYRETEAFKESIPLVRQLAKGMSVHHTSFTEYKKS